MIRVSRNAAEIQNILMSPVCEFPISSFRTVATDYLTAILGTSAPDRSFIVLADESPVACVLLASKESHPSFMGLPIRIEFADQASSSPSRTQIMKTVAKELRFSTRGGASFTVDIPILGERANVLVESLASDAVAHRVHAEVAVKLTDTGDITSNLSGPHRRNVRKGREVLGDPTIFFGEIDSDVFKKFRDLHLESAGRQTRSDQSWQEMREAILGKTASLTTAYEGETLVGATFTWLSRSSAYYGTGAYDRTRFHEVPISHITMVSAIAHARDEGCSVFIVGEAYAPEGSDKAKGIAQFKRGFSPSRNYFHRLTLEPKLKSEE